MIQRKDSIGFVEIIRGKYTLTDEAYISRLLGEMSMAEIIRITSQPFERLWSDLWSPLGSRAPHSVPQIPSATHPQSATHGREFAESRAKFNIIRDNGLLARLSKNIPGWASPEWGFPKGRRNGSTETPISCAMREFTEETGLDPAAVLAPIPQSTTVIVTPPAIEEVFVGSNGITYRHIYYLMRAHGGAGSEPIELCVPDNSCEVSDITWVTPAAGHALIRPYESTKHEILNVLETYLKNPHGLVSG